VRHLRGAAMDVELASALEKRGNDLLQAGHHRAALDYYAEALVRRRRARLGHLEAVVCGEGPAAPLVVPRCSTSLA